MASSILAAPEGPVRGTFFTPAATCEWIKTRSTRNSPEHQAGQPAEGWPNSRLALAFRGRGYGVLSDWRFAALCGGSTSDGKHRCKNVVPRTLGGYVRSCFILIVTRPLTRRGTETSIGVAVAFLLTHLVLTGCTSLVHRKGPSGTELGSAGSISVPFTWSGHSPLVEVYLGSAGPYRFLVDTGVSTMVISPECARAGEF